MDGEEIIKEVQKGGPVTAKQDKRPIIREWVSLHMCIFENIHVEFDC